MPGASQDVCSGPHIAWADAVGDVHQRQSGCLRQQHTLDLGYVVVCVSEVRQEGDDAHRARSLPSKDRQPGTLGRGLLLKGFCYVAQASRSRTVRLCNENGLTRVGQGGK